MVEIYLGFVSGIGFGFLGGIICCLFRGKEHEGPTALEIARKGQETASKFMEQHGHDERFAGFRDGCKHVERLIKKENRDGPLR